MDTVEIAALAGLVVIGLILIKLGLWFLKKTIKWALLGLMLLLLAAGAAAFYFLQ